MPFFVWCEIVCIECSDTIAGRHVSGKIPRHEMKRDASRNGWKFDEDGNAKCLCCLNGSRKPDRPSMMNT